MEAENIVGICHQATTCEHIADWEDFLLGVVNFGVCELAITLQLLVVNV
jgi:hypothetical protein